MVRLSKNEIRARAAAFAAEWAGVTRERGEAQPFQEAFFGVLGVKRRNVAIYEQEVKYRAGGHGFIDLFWSGQILVEMKSAGEDLVAAYEQALGYVQTLQDHEIPHAILVCDFEHWDFYDLDEGGKKVSFTLAELPKHIDLFFYLAGYEGGRKYREEDPVNVKAAELMGRLHDLLKEVGYEGHDLEVYLVRLLFCLFADDTGIFSKDDFLFFLKECTAEDGRDLGQQLAMFFQVLNTPEDRRSRVLDETLKAFPYINGGLFKDWLPIAAFDAEMRRLLLECCVLDWGKISPAIFGSMFQSVMNPVERRALGAHYTSERNILKLIRPLFMDALRDEFDRLRADRSTRRMNNLRAFHEKLAGLRFLDPACGCGNFLVIAYRELRLLELDVLRVLDEDKQSVLDVSDLCKVNVGQFYGIEIEDFPAQIAQVAMWLMDHQMNRAVGDYFGQYFARIPLRQSATIRCANALTMDWAEMVPPSELSYILGNPPFVGHQWRSKQQAEDMARVFHDTPKHGKLDFVCCWFRKAVDFMLVAPSCKTAFVATNSIAQGESVAYLWKPFADVGISIDFAYSTFKWSNEGKGIAAVHCVIVGFCLEGKSPKRLYNQDGCCNNVNHINGYLVGAPDAYIQSRGKPLQKGFAEMSKGSQPTDGGNLLLSHDEKEDLIANWPETADFIRPYIGAEELIRGKKRWCLWLQDVMPQCYRHIPAIMKRLEAVAEMRRQSPTASVRAAAKTPSLFTQIRQPQTSYIVIPEVSSETREYIPMSFLDATPICANTVYLLPMPSLYCFGVMLSGMHMAWMRTVAGRLKSDYRYTPAVYNNFPWPEADEGMQGKIAELAQGVLDARALYPGSTLADLYDPLTMPPELVKAHAKLDAAVEKAYGRRFADDAERVTYLFELYGKLV